MGYPQGHKEKTRQTIVQAARRLWKSQGYGGASVDKVMEEAGLTRGGFYAHFKSKEDLLVEALSEQLAADVIADLKESGVHDYEEQRGQILDYYLSQRHRDHPELGCPLTSLAQEAVRCGKGPRGILKKAVQRFSGWLSGERKQENGLAALSLMVGAITLARAMEKDDPLGADVLIAARRGADDLLGRD